MSKKILLYIDSMGSGGAERQMVGLAKYLHSVPEYNVRLIFYKRGADFYVPQLKENGINYIYQPSSSNKFFGFFFLRKQVKEFKPDLIISFLGKNNLFSSLNRIICHIPLIVSERNTTIKPTLSDSIRFFLYRWDDKIIPNSFSQANYLKTKHRKLSSKVFPIINFVDTDYFSPLLKQRDNKKKDIVVVARVAPQKNVLGFIQAIKMVVNSGIENFHISWIGSLHNKEYASKCLSLLKKEDICEFFSFDGEKHDIRSVYLHADAFCLPSFYEGTPNVICEATASGLPILCSDVCDNHIYVKNNVSGFLFNPRDANSISKALIEFLNSTSSDIDRMKKCSRQMAVSNFSIAKFNSAWKEQIEELI